MPIINSIVAWLMKKRMHQIELFTKYPYEVQHEGFRKLLDTAKDTEWGRKYGYSSIASVEEFRRRIPIQEYDDLKPYIDRLRKGEQNVLWPSEIVWFAKSSGTTNDKSKYIPVSEESLNDCHFKGGKDMLTLYCNAYPETHLFDGKTMSLAGSYNRNQDSLYARDGDLSAILTENLPLWAEFFRAPDKSITLMSEWEEKMDKFAAAIMNENITALSAVPSLLMVLLKYTLKVSGKKSIAEMWPNLEIYFHGGVNFTPYREQFEELFKPLDINFWELYNASEGFFGIQDSLNDSNMLLMLDYGIFYEFLPMENIGKKGPCLSLHEVKPGVNYALVISTSGGLWRYLIGDTIKFSSVNPFRFTITGRVKQFINAFGEELIMDNAEKAIKIACERTNASIEEYTAGPIYMNGSSKGSHEWLIEFNKQPENMNYFREALDNALKSINSDYEAKRYKDMTLTAPIVHAMPKGTFFEWMKKRGKLGGQHKVPRLANDRKYLDDILGLIDVADATKKA
jgi:hypothetical protein